MLEAIAALLEIGAYALFVFLWGFIVYHIGKNLWHNLGGPR